MQGSWDERFTATSPEGAGRLREAVARTQRGTGDVCRGRPHAPPDAVKNGKQIHGKLQNTQLSTCRGPRKLWPQQMRRLPGPVGWMKRWACVAGCPGTVQTISAPRRHPASWLRRAAFAAQSFDVGTPHGDAAAAALPSAVEGLLRNDHSRITTCSGSWRAGDLLLTQARNSCASLAASSFGNDLIISSEANSRTRCLARTALSSAPNFVSLSRTVLPSRHCVGAWLRRSAAPKSFRNAPLHGGIRGSESEQDRHPPKGGSLSRWTTASQNTTLQRRCERREFGDPSWVACLQ
jgi:hypothetical protein